MKIYFLILIIGQSTQLVISIPISLLYLLCELAHLLVDRAHLSECLLPMFLIRAGGCSFAFRVLLFLLILMHWGKFGVQHLGCATALVLSELFLHDLLRLVCFALRPQHCIWGTCTLKIGKTLLNHKVITTLKPLRPIYYRHHFITLTLTFLFRLPNMPLWRSFGSHPGRKLHPLLLIGHPNCNHASQALLGIIDL